MFFRRFHELGHNYADKHHYIHLYEKMNNIGGGENQSNTHCVESVHILSFSGPNAGKYGPRKTPNTNLFHAVTSIKYRY